jgi:hypothetical protein
MEEVRVIWVLQTILVVYKYVCIYTFNGSFFNWKACIYWRKEVIHLTTFCMPHFMRWSIRHFFWSIYQFLDPVYSLAMKYFKHFLIEYVPHFYDGLYTKNLRWSIPFFASILLILQCSLYHFFKMEYIPHFGDGVYTSFWIWSIYLILEMKYIPKIRDGIYTKTW